MIFGIAYFGGVSAAARGLNLRPQTVQRWEYRGIPYHTQYWIEAWTDGALLAPPLPARGSRARIRKAQRIAVGARRAEPDTASTQQARTVAGRSPGR